MSKTPKHHPEHWAADNPILVETLAAAVHTSILDVCEHLEDNVVMVRNEEPGRPQDMAESIAVQLFLHDYVAA